MSVPSHTTNDSPTTTKYSDGHLTLCLPEKYSISDKHNKQMPECCEVSEDGLPTTTDCDINLPNNSFLLSIRPPPLQYLSSSGLQQKLRDLAGSIICQSPDHEEGSCAKSNQPGGLGQSTCPGTHGSDRSSTTRMEAPSSVFQSQIFTDKTGSIEGPHFTLDVSNQEDTTQASEASQSPNTCGTTRLQPCQGKDFTHQACNQGNHSLLYNTDAQPFDSVQSVNESEPDADKLLPSRTLHLTDTNHDAILQAIPGCGLSYTLSKFSQPSDLVVRSMHFSASDDSADSRCSYGSVPDFRSGSITREHSRSPVRLGRRSRSRSYSPVHRRNCHCSALCPCMTRIHDLAEQLALLRAKIQANDEPRERQNEAPDDEAQEPDEDAQVERAIINSLDPRYVTSDRITALESRMDYITARLEALRTYRRDRVICTMAMPELPTTVFDELYADFSLCRVPPNSPVKDSVPPLVQETDATACPPQRSVPESDCKLCADPRYPTWEDLTSKIASKEDAKRWDDLKAMKNCVDDGEVGSSPAESARNANPPDSPWRFRVECPETSSSRSCSTGSGDGIASLSPSSAIPSSIRPTNIPTSSFPPSSAHISSSSPPSSAHSSSPSKPVHNSPVPNTNTNLLFFTPSSCDLVIQPNFLALTPFEISSTPCADCFKAKCPLHTTLPSLSDNSIKRKDINHLCSKETDAVRPGPYSFGFPGIDGVAMLGADRISNPYVASQLAAVSIKNEDEYVDAREALDDERDGAYVSAKATMLEIGNVASRPEIGGEDAQTEASSSHTIPTTKPRHIPGSNCPTLNQATNSDRPTQPSSSNPSQAQNPPPRPPLWKAKLAPTPAPRDLNPSDRHAGPKASESKGQKLESPFVNFGEMASALKDTYLIRPRYPTRPNAVPEAGRFLRRLRFGSKSKRDVDKVECQVLPLGPVPGPAAGFEVRTHANAEAESEADVLDTPGVYMRGGAGPYIDVDGVDVDGTDEGDDVIDNTTNRRGVVWMRGGDGYDFLRGENRGMMRQRGGVFEFVSDDEDTEMEMEDPALDRADFEDRRDEEDGGAADSGEKYRGEEVEDAEGEDKNIVDEEGGQDKEDHRAEGGGQEGEEEEQVAKEGEKVGGALHQHFEKCVYITGSSAQNLNFWLK